jgi:mRNA interferase RelE/StbE
VTNETNPWSVQLSSIAIRALNQLPRKVASAIAEFVTVTLPQRPTPPLKALALQAIWSDAYARLWAIGCASA